MPCRNRTTTMSKVKGPMRPAPTSKIARCAIPSAPACAVWNSLGITTITIMTTATIIHMTMAIITTIIMITTTTMRCTPTPSIRMGLKAHVKPKSNPFILAQIFPPEAPPFAT